MSGFMSCLLKKEKKVQFRPCQGAFTLALTYALRERSGSVVECLT